MKNLLNFAMILCTCFYLSSCSDDNESKVKKELPNIEEYVAKKQQENITSGKKVKVEHCTLDELNAAMRANGLEEYSRADIARMRESMSANRTVWECETWQDFGDWNENGTFNSVDLVLANNWICQNSNFSCRGTIDLETCTNCPPYGGYEFAILSWLQNDVDPWKLNRNDADAGVLYLVGNIPCN